MRKRWRDCERWNGAPILNHQRWNSERIRAHSLHTHPHRCVCARSLACICACACCMPMYLRQTSVERYALPWFLTQTFIFLTVRKIALLFCCSTYSCVRVYSIICFIHFVFAFSFFFFFLAHFVFDKAEIFSKNEHYCCCSCMNACVCVCVSIWELCSTAHAAYSITKPCNQNRRRETQKVLKYRSQSSTEQVREKKSR